VCVCVCMRMYVRVHMTFFASRTDVGYALDGLMIWTHLYMQAHRTACTNSTYRDVGDTEHARLRGVLHEVQLDLRNSMCMSLYNLSEYRYICIKLVQSAAQAQIYVHTVKERQQRELQHRNSGWQATSRREKERRGLGGEHGGGPSRCRTVRRGLPWLRQPDIFFARIIAKEG
jgi:hypothetical protein